MRKLGLDLGTKTCGIAISDEMCIIATGLENFHYDEGNFNVLLDRIQYWLEEYQNKVDTIVLGYPTNAYDGSMNPRSYLVLDFKELLIKRFPELSVQLYDERFTTRIATNYLKEYNVKNSQRKKVKDKMSAVVILTDYITANKYQHFN